MSDRELGTHPKLGDRERRKRGRGEEKDKIQARAEEWNRILVFG